ncbi:hypothetical protein [Luteimonas salinilitoris]|uniref:Uncharacterized protein n=1 Tax=Luteimonas salinilitoris TaxID=3237697 RepID=A0ABV4HTA9_9GAMM
MRAALPHPRPHDTPGVAPVPDAAASPFAQTALQRLVHLLQGGEGPALADAGIARLPPARLEVLSRHALEESETCLERAELMLRLAEAGLEHDAAVVADDMLRIGRHVMRLLQDHRRWRELAGNAAYYRDHPEATARTAAARGGTDEATIP